MSGEWNLDHINLDGSAGFGPGIQANYTSKFREVLDEHFEQIIQGITLVDDTGEEYVANTIDDWADTAAASQYFQDVAAIYQDTMDFLDKGSTDREHQEAFKQFFSPNAIAAAAKLVNEMVVAQAEGEANIAEGKTPEGVPIPIEEQVSEDEDQAAINAYQGRVDQAAKEKAEEDNKTEGEPAADSVSFKEQCFITSRMVDIIEYKYQTISKFKKLPYYGDTLQTNDTPSNASLLIHDDPFHFINKMLVYPDTMAYFDMKSEEIANLQPQVRFFKSVYDSETKEERNVEIRFDTTFTNPNERGTSTYMKNSTSLESLLKDQNKRNAGVGMKSFDLSFIGTDPFAAKKDLRATLKIYAASMDELFKARGPASGLGYRYIDLALKTVTGNNAGSPKINIAARDFSNMTRAGTTTDDITRMDFIIKAKLGIMPPFRTVASNQDLMAAIMRNSCTVQMTPVTHEFNFNEDGSLEFVIHYVPFVHDHYNSSLFDVFGSRETIIYDLETKLYNIYWNQLCHTEGKDERRKADLKRRKEIRNKHLQYFINRLYRKQLIHYLTVPPEVVKVFNMEGPAADISAVFGTNKRETKSGKEKTEEEIKQEIAIKKAEEAARKIVLKNSSGNPVSISDNNIPFVYLHDIIDIALENVEASLTPDDGAFDIIRKNFEDMALDAASPELNNPNATGKGSPLHFAESGFLDAFIQEYRQKFHEARLSFKKFRVLLGPIEIVDPSNSKNVVVVSLGDIPISLRYFQEFLTDAVLSSDRQRFPVASFLQKLIGKMLSSFLNNDTCFGGAVKHKSFLSRTEALCYNSNDKYDDITYKILQARKNALKANGMKPKKSVNDKSFEDIPVVDRLLAPMYAQPILSPVGFGANELDDDSGSRNQYQYLMFYAARTSAIGAYNGNKEADSKRGCHHYKLGRDRGILKKMTLNRDKRPMLKEARFEAEGYDGLQQFKEVYNVDVETYVNFNVFPGAKIYVDPEGWAPNMTTEFLEKIGGNIDNLTDLGIGGYYDVTKVEHTFAPGQFDTKFTAYWTNGIGQPNAKLKESPTKKKNNRCKVKRTEKTEGTSTDPEVNKARSMGLSAPPFLKNMATAMGFELDKGAIENDDKGAMSKVISVFKMNSSPTWSED